MFVLWAHPHKIQDDYFLGPVLLLAYADDLPSRSPWSKGYFAGSTQHCFLLRTLPAHWLLYAIASCSSVVVVLAGKLLNRLKCY